MMKLVPVFHQRVGIFVKIYCFVCNLFADFSSGASNRFLPIWASCCIDSGSSGKVCWEYERCTEQELVLEGQETKILNFFCFDGHNGRFESSFSETWSGKRRCKNGSRRGTLRDKGFKSQECCFFHPLSNDMSIGTAKTCKPSNASTKEKPSGTMNSSITYADPDKFVDEILEKTRTIVLSEIKEDENIEKYREQLATIVSNNISKQLGMELKNLDIIFKNVAYTEGFKAGIHHQPKRM
ncbi:hypothetical protein SASPL_100829 [Salvia splendens]|uniref:Uncharacterized protein n=1 Tax=Salvia splendens TaxID=180675 RepID=A0A8X8YUP0_SALSN|nr:hypothetical protein SASPL_100829 [Salvia splendens]